MTVIRPLTEGDAEATGRMHLAAWHEAYDGLLPDTFWATFTEEARIAAFTRMARRSVAGPADRRGRARGPDRRARDERTAPAPTSRTAARRRPPLELYALYVLASEYGSGTGGRLLEAVIPEGAAAELWVFEAEPPGPRLLRQARLRPRRRALLLRTRVQRAVRDPDGAPRAALSTTAGCNHFGRPKSFTTGLNRSVLLACSEALCAMLRG